MNSTNDNNQGPCWALVRFQGNPQTLAAPNGDSPKNQGAVASPGGSPVARRPRGPERVKRYPIQIEVEGAPVACVLEIHQGKTLVLRRKHGKPFHTTNLAEIAFREFRLTKGELCL